MKILARFAIDSFVLARPGPFFFAVPEGTYRLAVFEDRNADLSYQPASEPAALYAAGSDLVVRAGQHVEGLDMVLHQEQAQRIDFEIGSLQAGQRGVAQLPAFHVGTIVSIDDPRFAADNATLGLWQPVQFVFDVGAGVYFLEAYHPEKIPVLFVHGAVGTPRNFAFLIHRLDRTRFQPWVVYYPTALDLESTARAVNRCMLLLHARYRYAQIAVVAHSMGGLVARAAINQGTAYLAGRRLVVLPVFVTMSTPWDGHAAASLGVKYAPVVAPSWNAMVPGNQFLQTLLETHLPPETHYHLFFSYQGSSMVIREASDNIVAVSSQLPLALQRQATSVLGFNENHMSILTSEAVATELNRILARIDR
jgi:pimeloyl-ACP methyl ester carboxylesterase